MSISMRGITAKALTAAAMAAVVVTGTAGSASAAHAYAEKLVKGEYLGAGDYIERMTYSGDGYFRLIMQSDGNLVLYRVKYSNGDRKVCWASNTQYIGGGNYVTYQQDGNFVMYPRWSNTAVWHSNTYGGGGSTVDINKFGVLYVGTTQISSQAACTTF
ncbi:hypothetical protein ACH4M4_09595 [Streptomyces sp. NPDC017254]|uniref:hypothetical protein n=1 Tax=unclassified Streptomyces TaxID=2593676 RepID=UPI00378F1695